MDEPRRDDHFTLNLQGEKHLKTHAKESQNRDHSVVLEALIRAMARQAADQDFKAQRTLH